MNPNSPTVIGGSTPTALATAMPPATFEIGSTTTAIVPFKNTGSIVLRDDQLGTAQEMLGKLDFATITAGDITTLGHTAEIGLMQTLDGFLSGIDRNTNPQLFALFDRLQDGVADAKLPDLLVEIQQGKLGLGQRVLGFFSKKALADAAQKAYQATCDLVSGRTQTLQGIMQQLEQELATAMTSLLADLQKFEELKGTYHHHIDDFAIVAAVGKAFLEKAREHVALKRQQHEANPNAGSQMELQELETKLQLLESRALALEGVYTGLPANQLVLQQIQSAGVTTLQETATTATIRFSSIKMTLITLHGGLKVKGVQQLSARQAGMDRQLAEVRGALTKEVVTTAANAAGDNRLAQAQQIEQLIALTGEVHQIVEKARTTNQQKFDTARGMFASARQNLATLSARTVQSPS